MTLSENASRCGYCFSVQRLGFCVALKTMATPHGFADCLVRDLALAARAYDGPPLKAAESLRGGPDCPSHDMDAEADKCGWLGMGRPCGGPRTRSSRRRTTPGT